MSKKDRKAQQAQQAKNPPAQEPDGQTTLATVPSESQEDKFYRIHAEEGDTCIRCACEAFKHSPGPEKVCKHVRGLLDRSGADLLAGRKVAELRGRVYADGKPDPARPARWTLRLGQAGRWQLLRGGDFMLSSVSPATCMRYAAHNGVVWDLAVPNPKEASPAAA